MNVANASNALASPLHVALALAGSCESRTPDGQRHLLANLKETTLGFAEVAFQ